MSSKEEARCWATEFSFSSSKINFKHWTFHVAVRSTVVHGVKVVTNLACEGITMFQGRRWWRWRCRKVSREKKRKPDFLFHWSPALQCHQQEKIVHRYDPLVGPERKMTMDFVLVLSFLFFSFLFLFWTPRKIHSTTERERRGDSGCGILLRSFTGSC